MKTRQGLLAAAAALGLGMGMGMLAGSPARAECKLNQIMELPVTMLGTRPTVTLLVNGQPARFLVDSGSWASVIDTTAARALGLKLAKTDEKSRGVGGDVDLYFTTIDSLAINKDASLGKVDMLASVDVGGSGYIGLIGQNILGFADIEYDLPHGAIRFFKQDGCKGANLGYWGQPAAVEIDLTHTGKRPESRDRDPNHYDPGDLNRDVRAAAQINGQRVIVTFDTGASSSMLNRNVAARVGVTPDTPGAVSVGLFSGIGSERKAAWVAPFDSFALGDERINHTRLQFGDLDRVQTDMLLGADFFLSHRIFIANSLSKAFVSYVGGPVFNFEAANLAKARPADDAPGPSASSPASADSLIGQASSLVGRQDYAGASALLDQAITAYPKRADALVLRGRARLALGKGKDAMADFDQALALEPNNFDALLARGGAWARAGDLAKARQDLELAGRQNTPDGRARLRVAGAYESGKDFADAITQFDAVIADKTTDEMRAAAFNGRCWDRALMKQDLDKALADCNAALRIAPKDGDVFDSRALVHLRRGEVDLALADYDAAIRAQPPTAITLYARAAARLKKGLKADSEADLAAAKKLDPRIGDRAKAQGVVESDFDSAAAGSPKS
jgi:tetratricopeptide (TPR) repeat protein/predicted aspartyl protease